MSDYGRYCDVCRATRPARREPGFNDTVYEDHHTRVHKAAGAVVLHCRTESGELDRRVLYDTIQLLRNLYGVKNLNPRVREVPIQLFLAGEKEGP